LTTTPALRPRAAAIAFGLAAIAVTSAPAHAQMPAPDSGPRLVAPATTFADRTTTLRGSVDPGAAGHAVDVQRLDAARGWIRIASGRVSASGRFTARWRARRLGDATLRAVVRNAGDASAASDAAPTAHTTVMRAARSTWYGPGLYGRITACGYKLTRRIMGVAHRTLPCGTPVRLALGGRTIVVPVIDRGPYSAGLTYDVTAAAARAIGMTTTVTLGTLPRRGQRMDPPA
jgi:rare lipoprotein A